MLANIRKGQFQNLHKCANTAGVAIAENLISNRQCALACHQDIFSALSLSDSDFHLKALETRFVKSAQLSLVWPLRDGISL